MIVNCICAIMESSMGVATVKPRGDGGVGLREQSVALRGNQRTLSMLM